MVHERWSAAQQGVNFAFCEKKNLTKMSYGTHEGVDRFQYCKSFENVFAFLRHT